MTFGKIEIALKNFAIYNEISKLEYREVMRLYKMLVKNVKMGESGDMESSMDDLFSALKNAVKVESSSVADDVKTTSDDHEMNEDILAFENNKKDTEKIFSEIEQNLKKLPGLETEFDSLIRGKTVIPSDKSSIVKAKAADKKKAQDDWFTLPKPSDSKRRDLERDLTLIKHRAALDPKRHYKKERWQVPERFSVGTIVESKEEFFSSRINKKDRKSTIMESLMGDDVSNKYFKRKYTEIQDKKTSGRLAHYKKNKLMRKKY